MSNLLDDDTVLVERIAKEWTTLLAQVQLEARMFAERQIYGLTLAVQALIDGERYLPAALQEMQRYVRALRGVMSQSESAR